MVNRMNTVHVYILFYELIFDDDDDDDDDDDYYY